MKLNPEEVQMKGRLDEEGTEPVELEDDEVLAHETSFRFSPDPNDARFSIFVLQRNHFGVGIGLVEWALSKFGSSVTLRPIVGQARAKRLNRIHDPRAVTFEIDVPKMKDAQVSGAGISAGIEAAAEAVDAVRVQVTLKGRRGGALSNITKALQSLFSDDADSYVKKVSVRGVDKGADRVTVIDLLEPTVARRVSVEVDKLGVASLKSRLEALGDALTDAGDEADAEVQSPE